MIFDYAILNGDLLPVEQAKISIFNTAYFSSFGVYEAIKVDQGRPFYLEEHLFRLFKSAQMIDLTLDIDLAILVDWFAKLRSIATEATWSLRIIALGATEKDTAPVIAMQPLVLSTYPVLAYRQGAAAVLYEGQRAIPSCKSLNNLVGYLARREATRAGVLEGLLHHNGILTEGSRSNLFAGRQGQLITPPASDVLSGITRDIILQLMQETDYPVIETIIPLNLQVYDELFITSTSMHVMPITQVNGQPVGDGRVGPLTKVAMAQFEAHYRQMMRTI